MKKDRWRYNEANTLMRDKDIGWEEAKEDKRMLGGGKGRPWEGVT